MKTSRSILKRRGVFVFPLDGLILRVVEFSFSALAALKDSAKLYSGRACLYRRFLFLVRSGVKIARMREPRLDLTARFKEDRFAGTKEFSFQVDINILKYKFSSLGAPRQLIKPLLTVSES